MRNDVRVTRGIEGWVQHELVLASDTVNRLYSDFDDIVLGFNYPADDPRNTAASKALSHTNRFMNNGAWFTPFEQNPESDETAAKMLFACLMRVSGARKNLGYTHSSNQAEFMDYIREPANFVSTRLVVGQELKHIGDSPGVDSLTKVNARTIATYDSVFERIVSNGMTFNDEARQAAREFELDTVRVLANYVAVAAAVRGGDISIVPALEPKSISLDPAIVYPFSDEILTNGY